MQSRQHLRASVKTVALVVGVHAAASPGDVLVNRAARGLKSQSVVSASRSFSSQLVVGASRPLNSQFLVGAARPMNRSATVAIQSTTLRRQRRNVHASPRQQKARSFGPGLSCSASAQYPTTYQGQHRAVPQALPNPSLNRTGYGRRCKPGAQRLRHCRAPGLHRPPPPAG